MDSPKHPIALEVAQAWQRAKELATLSLLLSQKAAFQKYPELVTQVQETAIEIPSILSRRLMQPTDAEEMWLDFTFGEAVIEVQRLKTLLHLADELGLIAEAEGGRLLECIESTNEMLVRLQRGQPRENFAESPKTKLRPSSPVPSRRPPSSGGGSRGDGPWGSRS